MKASTSPWSDRFSTDTLGKTSTDESLGSLTNEVEISLNELVRIAVAIRRAGTKSRLVRADDSFDPDAYKELHAHLIAVINLRASSPVKGLDNIQVRLIMANLRRRNRFIYAQRHSEALGFFDVPALASAQTRIMGNTAKAWQWISRVSQSSLQTGTSILQKMRQTLEHATADALQEVTRQESTTRVYAYDSSAVTETSASGMSGYTPMQPTDTRSQGAATQMSVTTRKVEYPRPPVIAHDALVFKCPACCQSLPIMYAEGDRWK